ncbi:hypothetical protein B5G16_10925 [Alistipes sp. An66]|nr:hypothetical protein B5G16_10925 [Alistipes sp. An66]
MVDGLVDRLYANSTLFQFSFCGNPFWRIPAESVKVIDYNAVDFRVKQYLCYHVQEEFAFNFGTFIPCSKLSFDFDMVSFAKVLTGFSLCIY